MKARFIKLGMLVTTIRTGEPLIVSGFYHDGRGDTRVIAFPLDAEPGPQRRDEYHPNELTPAQPTDLAVHVDEDDFLFPASPCWCGKSKPAGPIRAANRRWYSIGD